MYKETFDKLAGEALVKNKGFFAFSDFQFKEGVIKAGTDDISSLGNGLYCPTSNKEALRADLDNASKESIRIDVENNPAEKIILRELRNYECFYSEDITDAVDALGDYGFTRDEVYAVFQVNFDKENQ